MTDPLDELERQMRELRRDTDSIHIYNTFGKLLDMILVIRESTGKTSGSEVDHLAVDFEEAMAYWETRLREEFDRFTGSAPSPSDKRLLDVVDVLRMQVFTITQQVRKLQPAEDRAEEVPQADTPPKFKVGDRVRVLAERPWRAEAHIGDTGTVLPYEHCENQNPNAVRVELDRGVAYWFDGTKHIELLTPSPVEPTSGEVIAGYELSKCRDFFGLWHEAVRWALDWKAGK